MRAAGGTSVPLMLDWLMWLSIPNVNAEWEKPAVGQRRRVVNGARGLQAEGVAAGRPAPALGSGSSFGVEPSQGYYYQHTEGRVHPGSTLPPQAARAGLSPAPPPALQKLSARVFWCRGPWAAAVSRGAAQCQAWASHSPAS